MTIEFLLDDPTFEDVALSYKPSLERIGIKVTIRTIDSAQYQNRVRDFDFDVVTGVFAQSLSPGNEQREFWGSAAADRKGSRNLIGIKNPVVDKIIDLIIFANEPRRARRRDARRSTACSCGITTSCPISTARRAGIRTGIASAIRRKLRPTAPAFRHLWWWDEEKAKKTAANK